MKKCASTVRSETPAAAPVKEPQAAPSKGAKAAVAASPKNANSPPPVARAPLEEEAIAGVTIAPGTVSAAKVLEPIDIDVDEVELVESDEEVSAEVQGQ